MSLLIGVNNQYQRTALEKYPEEFLELLETAIELAGGEKGKVMVLSIPDYAYTPFGQQAGNSEIISKEIDIYNAINKKISDSLEVAYFDITPISRQGLNNPALVASDGLHPSGEMYRLWVDLMVDRVIEILLN